MGTFVAKGGVSRLIVEKLDEGQTLEKTQLLDLLRRSSNCNYEAQVLAGLVAEQPLYEKIVSDVKATGFINTKLPNAKRYFINGTGTLGHSVLNVDKDVDDPIQIVFSSRKENVVGSHQMKEPSYTVVGPLFEFTRNKDVQINFKASLAMYDGTTKVGTTHPTPTFRFSNPEDNSVTFTVELVLVKANGDTDSVELMTGTFFKENIEANDIFSLYGTAKASFVDEAHVPVIGSGDPAYRGFYFNVWRSPYVATYGSPTKKDLMGFIMEGSVSAPSTDTSNYIEVIELSSIGD